MSRNLMPKSGAMAPYLVMNRDAAVAGVFSIDGEAGAVVLTGKYVQINAYNTRVGAVEQRVTTIEGQIVSINQSISDLNTAVSANTTAINDRAKKGANSDITELNSLTKAILISQGGTGSPDLLGARTNLQVDRLTQATDFTLLNAPDFTRLVVANNKEIQFQDQNGVGFGLPVNAGGTGALNSIQARRNLNTPVGSRAVSIPDGENVLAFVAAQAESGYYSCGNNATQLPTSDEGFWFFNFHCHGISNSGVADYGHLTAIGGSTGRMWHCRLDGLANWTAWQSIATGDDPLNSRYHLGLENFTKSGIEARVTDPSNPQRYFYINSDPVDPWGAYDMTAGAPIPLSVRGGGTGANNAADARFKLGLGPNDHQEFKSLQLNGKDYSFTVIGGEHNNIQMYAESNTPAPTNDWVNFTRYNWYNDMSASGAVRSGNANIKCHRIRVDSPSIDTSDFDFYPTGQLKARAFNVGTTSNSWWGIEQQESGNAIPFNTVSTTDNSDDFVPVVAGGTSTPIGYYTRFAIGMVSRSAVSWPRTVIKLLGDNDKHRGFEFGVDGGLVTWQASPNDSWGGNYDFAKNPTSDRDLKHDIQYTDGKESYDRVMQWLPTMFKYNGSDIQRFGLIAQDLLKIDPQYVKLVQGSPVFEDVIGVDENGEEYIDRQIETDRKDDTLALDSNVMLTDMACAMVYVGNKMSEMEERLAKLESLLYAK